MTNNIKKSIKHLLTFFKSILIALFFFYLVSFALDYFRGKSLPIKAIPNSAYVDLYNNPIDLNEISKDQITIVYFWATWCTPCKVTSPSMEQLAKSYPVISIAMASGESEPLKNYFNNEGTQSIPIINDDNRYISNLWGVQVTPTILFIKNGELLSHTTGISGYPSLWIRAWWLNR